MCLNKCFLDKLSLTEHTELWFLFTDAKNFINETVKFCLRFLTMDIWLLAIKRKFLLPKGKAVFHLDKEHRLLTIRKS